MGYAFGEVGDRVDFFGGGGVHGCGEGGFAMGAKVGRGDAGGGEEFRGDGGDVVGYCRAEDEGRGVGLHGYGPGLAGVALEVAVAEDEVCVRLGEDGGRFRRGGAVQLARVFHTALPGAVARVERVPWTGDHAGGVAVWGRDVVAGCEEGVEEVFGDCFIKSYSEGGVDTVLGYACSGGVLDGRDAVATARIK